MPRALIVEILGDAKQFGAELDRAAGKTRSMGKVAGVAGLAIAGGLAVGLDKSIKAAEDAQVSTARMEGAFKTSGESADKYSKQIDDAESSGRKLGFTSSDVKSSIGSLEIATHKGGLAIQSLGAAEDLARFKHISLEQATKSLTMAQTGSQRALKQLGLSIPPVTSAQDAVKASYAETTTAIHEHFGALGKLSDAQKLAETNALENAKADEKQQLAVAKTSDTQKTAASITQMLSDKLHGQADAFAHTAQGGAAVMHAQLEALQENLGQALIPAVTKLSGLMASLTGFFAEHAGVTKILVGVVGVLGATLLAVSIYTKLASAATVIWSGVTKAAEAAQWLLNAALDANPIGLVVIAIGTLVAAFVLAWKHSQTFRDIVTGVWNDVKAITRDFIGFFTDKVPGAFNAVRDKIHDAFSGLKDWFRDTWNDVKDFVTRPFDALIDAASGAFGLKHALSSAWADIKSALHDAFDAIGTIASNAYKGPINAVIAGWNKLGIPGFKVHINMPWPIPDINFDWGGLSLPDIPMLALGGIVRRPTLAIIGESGPEAVVPLSKPSAGAGATELHVHFEGPVFGDKAAVARELTSAIRAELVSIGRRESRIFTQFGVTA